MDTMQLRTVSSGLFVTVTFFSAVGVLLTTVLLVFNIKYRNLRLVRMSSPNMNVLITVGALFSYVCCVLFGVDNLTKGDLTSATLSCQVRTWLLTMSLSLVFGTMLAKSWRVYRIFRSSGTRRVVIKDEKLMVIVGVIVCVDVILMSFWQGFDPLHAQIVPIGFDVFQSTFNLTTTPLAIVECSSSNIPVWLSLIFLFKAVLFTSGLYLCWATRNVVVPSMNDAKYTILTIFTTTIVCSMASAVAVILRPWPDAVYACVAGAVWVSTTACLLFVFVPKIRLLARRKDTVIFQPPMKFQSTADMPRSQSVEHIEEEMYHLISENRILKKSLSEKEGAMQSLQDHLDNAKAKLVQLTSEADERNDSGLDVDISSAASSREENTANSHESESDSQHTTSHVTETSHVVEHTRDIQSSKYNQTKRSESMHCLRKTRSKVRRHGSKSGDSVRSDRSLRSCSSRCRISQLGDSIALDLQKAQRLSTSLRTSICKDLDNFSEKDIHYGSLSKFRGSLCTSSRKDLAGSIAESYNFGQDEDDWSYIRQFLQVSQPQTRAVYFLCNDGDMLPQTESPSVSPHEHSRVDTSVLANDRLYPDHQQRDRTRDKRRRDSKRNRNSRNGRKRHSLENIYTIQDPSVGKIASCVAHTKCLQGANGTYCLKIIDTFV